MFVIVFLGICSIVLNIGRVLVYVFGVVFYVVVKVVSGVRGRVRRVE